MSAKPVNSKAVILRDRHVITTQSYTTRETSSEQFPAPRALDKRECTSCSPSLISQSAHTALSRFLGRGRPTSASYADSQSPLQPTGSATGHSYSRLLRDHPLQLTDSGTGHSYGRLLRDHPCPFFLPGHSYQADVPAIASYTIVRACGPPSYDSCHFRVQYGVPATAFLRDPPPSYLHPPLPIASLCDEFHSPFNPLLARPRSQRAPLCNAVRTSGTHSGKEVIHETE